MKGNIEYATMMTEREAERQRAAGNPMSAEEERGYWAACISGGAATYSQQADDDDADERSEGMGW